ncbi:MAG: hydroxymethylbilane synthase [Actinomycetota bacterium]
MTLRIGTRRSRLALAQAGEVRERLASTGVQSELVPILTEGDRGAAAESSPAGLKGLFVAEIVRALLGGDVDVAVHSAKDLPAEDTPGVVLGAVPHREHPFDVLVSREPTLGVDAVVATSALRRRAQLARLRPELRVVEVRGNVDTRLSKLEAGDVDGLVLAEAGLARLGLNPAHRTTLTAGEMVPAPGQGSLAIQCRADDEATLNALAPLDDLSTHTALSAERALMVRMGGGCALPLGGFANVGELGVHLIGLVATPDGRQIVRAEARSATPDEVAAIVADDLVQQGAADILTAVREG